MVVDRGEVVRLEHQWQPDARAIRMPKRFRHYADDRARGAIEHNRRADDIGACIQDVAPEIMVHYGDWRRALITLFDGEVTAVSGTDTEHRKEIRGDAGGRHS